MPQKLTDFLIKFKVDTLQVKRCFLVIRVVLCISARLTCYGFIDYAELL
jgi:hypothetical protein